MRVRMCAATSASVAGVPALGLRSLIAVTPMRDLLVDPLALVADGLAAVLAGWERSRGVGLVCAAVVAVDFIHGTSPLPAWPTLRASSRLGPTASLAAAR